MTILPKIARVLPTGGVVAVVVLALVVFARQVLASGALDFASPVNDPGSHDVRALQVQVAGTTDVPPSASSEPGLFPARPDPARVSMTLRYALPHGAGVSLAIFDLTGRRIRSLVSESQAPGRHAVDWDLRDEQRRVVGIGLYFAKLDVEHRTLARTLLTVR